MFTIAGGVGVIMSGIQVKDYLTFLPNDYRLREYEYITD